MEKVKEDKLHVSKRSRKKKLYASIKTLVEFYLGDVNLSKDGFFAKLLREDSHVPISAIMKCHKIRALTCEEKHVVRALKDSDLLNVSEDGKKIFRKRPVSKIENIDECTVYIENIPVDADHEWVKSVFQEYGNVVYVSLPRYKQYAANKPRKLKGFAFVQFEIADSVDKALADFRARNAYLTNIVPDDLQSVKTFETLEELSGVELRGDVEPDGAVVKDDVEADGTIKDGAEADGSATDVDCEERDNGSNGAKTDEEEPRAKKKKMVSFDIDTPAESECVEESDVEKKNKSLKKKKLKSRKKKKVAHELRILSKSDWKRLRNRYLEEQRKKMREWKQYFKSKAHFENERNYDGGGEDGTCAEVPIPGKEFSGETKLQPFSEARVKFTPNVIVRILFEQSVGDAKKFKADVKRFAEVEYIDVDKNLMGAHLRCATAELAAKIVALKKWPTCEILTGNEESAYWDKIFNDREEKLRLKIRPKVKGKDKLMKKINAHIKFND